MQQGRQQGRQVPRLMLRGLRGRGGAWTKETRRHSPRGGSHWRGELSRKGVRRESEAGGSRTPSTLQASAEQKGGAVEKAGVPQAGNSPASRSHPTGRGAARGLSTTVLTLPRAVSITGGSNRCRGARGPRGKAWRQLSGSLAEKTRSSSWEETWSQGRDFAKL